MKNEALDKCSSAAAWAAVIRASSLCIRSRTRRAPNVRAARLVVFHYLDRFAGGAGLRARLRGHRFKAVRLAIPGWPYRTLIKIKNPAAPAVKREAEGEWRKIQARQA
jgi:hypothetical protein